jgi:hypothetical protein
VVDTELTGDRVKGVDGLPIPWYELIEISGISSGDTKGFWGLNDWSCSDKRKCSVGTARSLGDCVLFVGVKLWLCEGFLDGDEIVRKTEEIWDSDWSWGPNRSFPSVPPTPALTDADCPLFTAPTPNRGSSASFSDAERIREIPGGCPIEKLLVCSGGFE